MLQIDSYAYSNQLRSLHPVEKVLFAVATMLVTLIANSLLVSIVVLCLMVGILVWAAKIPFFNLLRLLLVPNLFLLTAVSTILISIGGDGADLLWSVELFDIRLGILSSEIMSAINLYFKSLAAISSLYCLILTTPLLEIIGVLRRLKVPEILLELMILIYRCLFILLDVVTEIRRAQLSRLGYASLRNAIFSVGKLISNLLLKSYQRAKNLERALESRCYQGEIGILERCNNLSFTHLIIILIVELSLVLLALVGGDLVG
ncbi:MAG: cobalt ECF transporter T component CbiQ [Bacillota bacterium]